MASEENDMQLVLCSRASRCWLTPHCASIASGTKAFSRKGSCEWPHFSLSLISHSFLTSRRRQLYESDSGSRAELVRRAPRR